jgi:hypothetical protein
VSQAADACPSGGIVMALTTTTVNMSAQAKKILLKERNDEL